MRTEHEQNADAYGYVSKAGRVNDLDTERFLRNEGSYVQWINRMNSNTETWMPRKGIEA